MSITSHRCGERHLEGDAPSSYSGRPPPKRGCCPLPPVRKVSADRELIDEYLKFPFDIVQRRAHQVDEQLLNFSDAVRPLGSSVGLLSSSYNLRVRLQRIRHLFHANASEAFPNKIQKEPVAPPKPAFFRPITSDLEELPHQFELLARDFLHFLHNIPELTDEGLNANVLNFEADLKYWASCLKEFEGW